MKKILIFSTTYFPFVGGAEIAVKEITQRLPDWQFDLITAKIQPDLANFEKIGNVNVYRVGKGCILDKYLFPWLAYFKAKKLHKRANYQIVQAIMAFYAGLAALFFKKKYPKVKYLLTMQSGDSDFFIWLRTWFWYPLYKKIYTKPDYIQAISHFLIKRARKYGYKGKIEVVPNGVHLDLFKLDTEVRPQQKSDLEFKILTVSRLVKKNGIDDLIKAGQYLKFPFKIIIIGIGADEEKLKKLAKDKGLEDKIIFKSQIEYSELPKYYALADVFVRPSLSEGLGNVFLEAMACGLPIIGTPIGGIPDFLKDKKTGLLCETRNPQSIAQKIRQILNNEQLRKTLTENGLKLVQEKYDWDLIAEKMNKIFKNLI